MNKFEKYNDLSKSKLEDALLNACKTASIEDLKYILTSPNLKSKVSINYSNGLPLSLAIDTNNFDFIKYMVESPDLNIHAKIDSNDYRAIGESIIKGDLELTKYFLNHPKLKLPKNLNSLSFNLVYKSLHHKKNIDIPKYLISFFTSKNALDLHHADDSLFISAYEKGNVNFINYLIFEHGFEKTEKIKNFLDSAKKSLGYNPHEEFQATLSAIESMFLSYELNSKMDVNKKSLGKVKI